MNDILISHQLNIAKPIIATITRAQEMLPTAELTLGLHPKLKDGGGVSETEPDLV
jgi:hypothetical protein